MRMRTGFLAVGSCLLALTLVLGQGCPPSQSSAGDASDPGGTTSPGDTTQRPISPQCGACHSSHTAGYARGPHHDMQDECVTCHANARDHIADPMNVRVQVDFSLESCARCHASHYESYLHDDGAKPGHFGGSAKTSKYLEFPHYKYLMGGHGFTLEYNEDRAHAYMLKDHIEIQRKQTTTCLQCKSTPLTYYWNSNTRGAVQFHKGMAWADAVGRIRQDWPQTADYGAGCTHCHDPHSGDFRLIRQGVIQNILQRGTDPYSKTLNVVPASQTELQALLNERDPDGRRTPEALRRAGTLTCAQCHIEYVCGQGADKATTGEIRDDVSWRKLPDIEAYYQSKFGLQQDWKHSVTGLTGIKPQHPETETYWGSAHHRLRMSCTDCHMAKEVAADGRTYSSHWLTSPLKNNVARCSGCHDDVAADIFRVQDETYARARQIEEKLNTLLQRIEASGTTPPPGVTADALASAKQLYMRALTWWEWTVVSENAMGAHNADEARAQLQQAEELADQGLALLP